MLLHAKYCSSVLIYITVGIYQIWLLDSYTWELFHKIRSIGMMEAHFPKKKKQQKTLVTHRDLFAPAGVVYSTKTL